MAKTVASVALTQPTADPNRDEGQTFAMGGQVTGASHGGIDYAMHFQWDQGTGTWVDTPATREASIISAEPSITARGCRFICTAAKRH